jgi:hypothetical protein
MTNQDIINELFRVARENNENFPWSTVSKRTVWEIFCYQNNIDEKSEGKEAQVFDKWCDIYELK